VCQVHWWSSAGHVSLNAGFVLSEGLLITEGLSSMRGESIEGSA
jgi:hypothetical protein